MSRFEGSTECEFEGTILSAICVAGLAIAMQVSISWPAGAAQEVICLAFALSNG